LLFDNVVAVADADARERFEAFARAVRDVLSQRWILTEQTYARENPKRVYYLSMEFLIGRAPGQQRDESAARSRGEGGGVGEAPRLARDARTGARRGAGERRARSPRRLLPR